MGASMSYHNSPKRLTITLHDELLQLVQASYHNSLRRLMVTRNAPSREPLARAFFKRSNSPYQQHQGTIRNSLLFYEIASVSL